MKREDIKPGARVEATRDLAGRYKKGTQGTIVSLLHGRAYGNGGWEMVDVMFDGDEMPYRVAIEHAEFQFRLVGGIAAQREDIRRRRREAGDE